MMQELAAGLRQAGLNIFRHRRGMLFVSPVRARVFGHERAGVSPSINGILEKVAAKPGIHRKELAEQLAVADADADAAERAKMTLANDLHWLISEGYVIEFNDGSLDLPRAKAPAAPSEEKSAQEKPASEPTGETAGAALETKDIVSPAKEPAVAGSADPGSDDAESRPGSTIPATEPTVAASPAAEEPLSEEPAVSEQPAVAEEPVVAGIADPGSDNA
jgi:hypothetical protein